uniref:Uncharacterized protein n=1 Tax=Amphora coffeiformis TaxID=265554 RepID=A0A7S3L540_9STRA|eukprot:scaffold3608_cov183-Amphora_coffeaeformis.AAC.1
MVTLSAKRPVRIKRRQQSQKGSLFAYKVPLLIVFLSFVFVLLTYYYLLGATSRNGTLPQIPQRLRAKMMQVKEILHEQYFRKTIVDCLPTRNPKCKTFVPESVGDNEKVQRVALVVPPGKVSLYILNHMTLLAQRYNNNPKYKGPNIEVFQTSHVPPYGYGKSHGLTRIVKLTPSPLMVHVVDALEAVLVTGQTMEAITVEDIQVALLQIMRFHCRLSHVAAHTASLSIDAAALRNVTELERVLQDFMIPNEDNSHVGPFHADLSLEETADEDENKVLSDQEFLETNLLTKLAGTLENQNTDALWAKLDQVLQDEMKRTKDQSIWPCPTFWGAEPFQLSTVTEKLAKALSPNCDDPYVSCFVQKDKCEAMGDPVCKKQ